MTCLSDDRLIRLSAGQLPQPEHQAAEEHLATCASCQERREAMQVTYDRLGQWEVVSPPRDLTHAVLAAAGRQSVHRRWYEHGRIAAAVLLAAGVGWTGGRWTRPAAPPAVGTVSTDHMAQVVGLDVLTGGDLLDGLFPADDPQDSSNPGGRS